MIIVDANVILRVILNDDEQLVKEAVGLIKNKGIIIKNEVLTEVIYVLLKVYKIEKAEICDCMKKLVGTKNVHTDSKEVVLCALDAFKDNDLNFVNSLLYAYYKVSGKEVFTFG